LKRYHHLSPTLLTSEQGHTVKPTADIYFERVQITE